jgi:methionyl-tRNA formyltransferase
MASFATNPLDQLGIPMPPPRIIFMGTPAFAVASLRALMEAGMPPVAVVTAPDRPAGRGLAVRTSAVKEFAMANHLLLMQPEKLKDPSFLSALHAAQADLIVVVAFRMLPKEVWGQPPLGCINLHASLLPQLRGAAPINWALMHGMRTTGLTTFRIQQEIDTGDVLLAKAVEIGADETAGELHDRLMTIGAELLVRTVQGLVQGTLRPTPQQTRTHAKLLPAPKLRAENTRLRLDMTATQAFDHVRGLSPLPGAWCTLLRNGRQEHLKILRAQAVDGLASAPPGTIRQGDAGLLLAMATGWLEVLELQPEGKRRMDAASFLRGLQAPALLSFS